MTDGGVTTYGWIFPDSNTIQLQTSIATNQTLKLLNTGSGTFNLDVTGSVTANGEVLISQPTGTTTALGSSNAFSILGNSLAVGERIEQHFYTYEGQTALQPSAVIGLIKTDNGGTENGELYFASRTSSADGSLKEHLRITSSGHLILADNGALKLSSSSTSAPFMQVTDTGSTTYEWLFPTSSSIQLKTHTTSDRELSLYNSAAGAFNLKVNGELNVLSVKDNGFLSTIYNTGTGSDSNGLDIKAGDHISEYILRCQNGAGTIAALKVFADGDVDIHKDLVVNGNVGLGVAPTTNYGKALQIHDTGTAGASLRLTDSNTGSDTGNGLELIQVNTHSYIVNREAGNMEFIVSGQTGMTINSSGRIGVDIAPQNNVNLTVGSPATLTNYYSFQATNASGNTRFLVDGVGSSFFYKTDNALGMKFDSSSGNVLVAKTTADSGTVGFEARATGEVMATAAGTATLYAKRNTNDGDVIVVQGPSGTVGSIGADGGSLVIGGGDVGIGFYQVANALVPYNGVTDLRDSAIDLGMASSGRFKDLHLSGTAFAYRMKAVTGSSGGSAHANADEIVAESNIDAGISILSGQSYKGSLFFGDSGLNSDGRIEYSQGNRSMTFATAGSDAVTIDSSANLGIGTADPQEQLHVYNGSTSAVIRVSGQGNINRKAEIGYNASAGPYVAAGSSGITSLKFYVDNTSLAGKFDTNGDFYSNDGTVHSLSDSRVKKDIADLTDGLAIVKQLKPRTFKFNGKATTLDDNRTRYGFIADEVMTVAPQYVSVDTQTIDDVEVDDFKSLSTTKMIPMLVKAIQEQQKVIESLTARITTLEG